MISKSYGGELNQSMMKDLLKHGSKEKAEKIMEKYFYDVYDSVVEAYEIEMEYLIPKMKSNEYNHK